MKNLTLFAALVGLLALVGCSADKSSDTRQVSKPNPPYKSPGPGGAPDPIQDNPNIPAAAKKSLQGVIPPH